MWSSAFTLAPLAFLFTLLVDLRLDAKRLLWIYKRPIAYRAQDIGKIGALALFRIRALVLFRFEKKRGVIIALNNFFLI